MTRTSTPARADRATPSAPPAPTCRRGGTRYSRSGAVIAARQAELAHPRSRAHRAYPCSVCLQPGGSAAWHVEPVSWWRRLLVGTG
ncbi:hypothetical protein EV189_0252 [Motilibacter rhizosphaerae]|uniref:Uncharacterized protein n=1 Tax=Motilibacter rhizosphaerae TaxID=598652 RepID=A0A4Q7NUX8_9ACTN|nr:hypothetical protein [Motilibacter rhizosphaerae]RZS91021.1 hypothetical protein EV189_0252 [Motilibacter rhizosphaerae]